MSERIDDIDGPPVPGRYYLVPCVRGQWQNVTAGWPVIGPLHSDRQFLDFPNQHYHIDGRFVNRHLRARFDDDHPSSRFHDLSIFDSLIVGQPLQVTLAVNTEGLPDPVLRRRRCVRADTPYPKEITSKNFHALWQHYAGRKAKRSDRGGWICPHRNVDLTSFAPTNGVLVCPLHGLCFDASNGHVIQRTA